MTYAELPPFPLTRRFLMGRCRDVLEPHDRTTLEGLFGAVPAIAGGACIYRAFSPTEHTTILVDGFVVRSLSEGGSRAIVGVFVPGDIIDLPALGFGELDHDLYALGPVQLARADREQLQQLALTQPGIGRAVWTASQLEAALQRQWTVKLGRLKASGRVARVLSELWCRLELVGLAGPDGFDVPMTQQDLADMCGTTAIHMNRALGELRREGLAEFRRGVVSAADRAALEAFGEFNMHYLALPHLNKCNVITVRDNHISM